jgi:gliding motility-associated-like protein
MVRRAWESGSIENPNTGLYAGTYTVIIVGQNGCVSSFDTTLINEFLDCGYHIYLPNVFTPDGENDMLYVRGEGIKEFTLAMYNRWGNRVFETNDLATGWDGAFREHEQGNAVFIFYLTGEFIDGAAPVVTIETTDIAIVNGDDLGTLQFEGKDGIVLN